MRGMCHHNSRANAVALWAEWTSAGGRLWRPFLAVRPSSAQCGRSLEVTGERHRAEGSHGIVEFFRPRAQKGKAHSKVADGNRRESGQCVARIEPGLGLQIPDWFLKEGNDHNAG